MFIWISWRKIRERLLRWWVRGVENGEWGGRENEKGCEEKGRKWNGVERERELVGGGERFSLFFVVGYFIYFIDFWGNCSVFLFFFVVLMLFMRSWCYCYFRSLFLLFLDFIGIWVGCERKEEGVREGEECVREGEECMREGDDVVVEGWSLINVSILVHISHICICIFHSISSFSILK